MEKQTNEEPAIQPVKIFYSYAHEDERLVKDVQKQLCLFKRQLRISSWHDRDILAGIDGKREISQHLLSAQIILLFVSADFIASDYCYSVELTEALRRHDAGEAKVIPIILKPCPWERAPFARLQALPEGGRALIRGKLRDDACLSVAHGIMSVVDALNAKA